MPQGFAPAAVFLWRNATGFVIARPQRGRGDLGKAITISPIAFPRCGRVPRDCTPRALPRASRSGRHVGLRPPRNDKSGSLALLNHCYDTCNCIRRLLSAATDAIGAYHFNAALYESALPSRDSHVASLLAMTIRGPMLSRHRRASDSCYLIGGLFFGIKRPPPPAE